MSRVGKYSGKRSPGSPTSFALPIADFGLAYGLSKGDRHVEKFCRNGGGIQTLILAVEEIFELSL